MKHLYFVRHGESYVNTGGRFCTRVGNELDLGLTDTGIEQATNDGERAAGLGQKFDLILSSPLARARETAVIIAEQVGYPRNAIEQLDSIKELDFGILEGTDCELFYNEHTYADLDQYANAETVEELQQRAERALKYISSLPQDTILVVSHSLFGRAFRRVIEGIPYSDEFTHDRKAASLPHGEILKLI